MRSATIYVLGGVAVAALAAVTALVLYGPADVPIRIAEAMGALFALVVVPLAGWLLRDADGDGVPDILQRGERADADGEGGSDGGS